MNFMKCVRKIGVFGGTFNPIHAGHEKVAIEFYDKCGIDKLIVIPTFMPPHKNPDVKIPPRKRLEMCRLAFNSEKYAGYDIEVSDIEIKKEGKSYSFDTVTSLYDIYNKNENMIYFLIGTDMFFMLEKWYRYEELLNLCTFAVALRNASDYSFMPEIRAKRDCLIKKGYKIILLENEAFEISSTELRDKIKCGFASESELRRYLNGDVLRYITEEKLYIT